MKEHATVIHSYPWYISDWRSSETRMRMTLAQRGLYRELLDYCWLEGSIPSDLKTLLLIAGTSSRDFTSSWVAVKDCFYLHEDGRYHNIRVDEGRGKLQSWVESRRAAGKKGGLAQAIAKAGAKPTSEQELKPSTTTTTATATAAQIPLPPLQHEPEELGPDLNIHERVSATVDGWPTPAGFVLGVRLLCEAVTESANPSGTLGVIEANMPAWREYYKGQKFKKNLDNFVRGGDWMIAAPAEAAKDAWD